MLTRFKTLFRHHAHNIVFVVFLVFMTTTANLSGSKNPNRILYILFLATVAMAAVSWHFLPGIIHEYRQIIAANRRHNNQCVKCGYDLRATPAKCPECGTETDHHD